MERATFQDLIGHVEFHPPPTPGVHTFTVIKVSARGTRRYLLIETDTGCRCEIGLGDGKTYERRLRVLLGTVPDEDSLKEVLAGRKFRAQLEQKLYKGNEYWEVSRP